MAHCVRMSNSIYFVGVCCFVNKTVGKNKNVVSYELFDDNKHLSPVDS